MVIDINWYKEYKHSKETIKLLNEWKDRIEDDKNTVEYFKKSYDKAIKNMINNIFYNDKNYYREIQKRFSKFKPEPIFDWKRRKSTL